MCSFVVSRYSLLLPPFTPSFNASRGPQRTVDEIIELEEGLDKLHQCYVIHYSKQQRWIKW